MENSNPVFTHKSVIEDDILYHFSELLNDLNRIKLDYNRDTAILYKMNNIIGKIELIIGLYLGQDKPVFRALKIYVNKLIKDNPEISTIIVHVNNTRCKTSTRKISTFKIEV